jgi:histidyl-tRNA synthetase
MAVSSPRGMRDFLPADKRRRDDILGVIRETYLRHGFEEIETPAIEDSASLHSGLGGDNEKLSFSILKRGLSVADVHEAPSVESLSDLGLRFDLTVPLARFYATHRQDLPGVFRSFHTGPVWRAERPQKGRYRQFVQCDIDIVGEAHKLAEVEVLLATSDALDVLGVEDFIFRVNDRRLLTELLSTAGIPAAEHQEALIVWDKLDKIGADGVMQELVGRLSPGFDTDVISRALTNSSLELDAQAIAQAMGGGDRAHQVAQELTEWSSQVQKIVGNNRLVVDLTLVRGMGYYTGSIVEISHPDWGTSIGGGGRYDGMIGRFLGTDVPAFGLSLGFERLLELLPTHTQTHPNWVALVSDSQQPTEQLVKIKMALVKTGHTVRLVQKTRNMKPTYERLVHDGFSRVADITEETHDISSLVWRDLG